MTTTTTKVQSLTETYGRLQIIKNDIGARMIAVSASQVPTEPDAMRVRADRIVELHKRYSAIAIAMEVINDEESEAAGSEQ